MGLVMAAALELVALHTPDGRTVLVNPAAVTEMHAPLAGGRDRLFHGSVKCVIRFSDHGYATVAETCKQVRELFLKEKPQ